MAKKKKTPCSLISILNLSGDVEEVVEAGFSKCSTSQVETALDAIIPHLLSHLAPDCESDTSIVPSILTLLKTLDSWDKYGKRHNVQSLFLQLSGLVSDDSLEPLWRNHMVQLTTKFIQTTHYNEHSKIALALLKHLFHVALDSPDKPVTNADIKRIKDLKPFILNIDLLEPAMTPILNYFMKAIVSLDFLKLKEGVVVLAYFLSREATLVKRIQTTIRDNLHMFSKNIAGVYGEVYFHAWILAEDGSEVKKEIEHRCIQDLMLRMMTLKRNGLFTGPIGTLVFAILRTFHVNRRLTKFSVLITDLYQPILWRSLKDSNPLVRCNAARVFFDVFPLEKGSGVQGHDNCQLKDMQVKEIKDLLMDECHLVRIIAIEGIGTIFRSGKSSVLAVQDISEIMNIVTEKLINDVSTFKVREAVLAMFESLITNSDTRRLVIPLIKMSSIKLRIHDSDEHVRKAFVKILIRLKAADDPDAKFWDLVELKHLLIRLEKEGPLVGEVLTKLLFDFVYKEGQPVSKTINNLIKIINISPDALLKLFKYSKSVASSNDVYYIILTIVGILKRWIKDRLAALAAEAENTSGPSSKKLRKKTKALKDVTNSSECGTDDSDDNDTDASSSSSKEQAPEETQPRVKGNKIDNHVIVAGLLNGAALLWATNQNSLNEAGHTEKLNELACSLIPNLLLYYKGHRVYYSVVSFASIVPIRVLSVNCTITGAIMAELRKMDENTDEEILNCLVMSMNLWGRTQDIVELAIEWLNYAFKHEDLNSTLVPRPHKRKRLAKVRFETSLGKPLLAVKFLNMLFNHVACEKYLVSKAYDMLYEFQLFLDRIKVLIVRRLENGKEFEEPDLSDTFLKRCLKVYLDMFNLLHRPDQPPADVSFTSDVDGPQPLSTPLKSIDMLNWAYSSLVPYVSGEINDQYNFAADCLELIMKNVTVAIDEGRTNKELALLAEFFVTKLLDLGNPVRFVEAILDLLRALLEYCFVYTREDEWLVFSNLSVTLKKFTDILETMDIQDRDLSQFAKDQKRFKHNLFVPLTVYLTFYGATHQKFLDICNVYLQLSLELISKELHQEENMDVRYKLDDHPLIVSLVVKYFLSKKVPVILPWLQAYLLQSKEEAVVFSAFSLLSTLALSCKSHFESAHLENCFNICFQRIRALPEEWGEHAAEAEELLLRVCRESGCGIQTT